MNVPNAPAPAPSTRRSRRQLVYDQMKAERDELADELADFYPEVAEQWPICCPASSPTTAIEHLNAHALPRNRGRLLCAELVARGLDGWVNNSVQTPCITGGGLPSFARGREHGRLSVAALALVRGPARAVESGLSLRLVGGAESFRRL